MTRTLWSQRTSGFGGFDIPPPRRRTETAGANVAGFREKLSAASPASPPIPAELLQTAPF
jgi:hypothetical protein